MIEMLHHPMKASLDIVALSAIVGSSWGHLPEIAAVAGGLWYSIQIGEWIWNKVHERKAAPKT
jgi:hypothetical protein